MGYFSKPWRWLVAPAAIGILLAAGCGGDSSPVLTPTPTPAPKRPVLIAWGSTGVLWAGLAGYSTSPLSCASDVVLIGNFIKGLAQKETGIKILYSIDSNCDPRRESSLCNLASEWSQLAPFFNMVNEVGTIEFKSVSGVDPFGYDVVILDCCRGSLTAPNATLENYINNATRGGVIVVASNSCRRSGTGIPTSQYANTLTAQYGITYTTEDLHDNTCFAIPGTLRTGLMAGVSSVSLLRATPMTVTAPAQMVLTNAAGQPVVAVYERVNP
jgi:hypothetical protein